MFFGGDSQGTEHGQSFTCPLCGQLGYSEPELREHVTKQHADGVPQEVICPVCATHPSGDPNHLTDDLPTHLTVEHRALREMEISLCTIVHVNVYTYITIVYLCVLHFLSKLGLE